MGWLAVAYFFLGLSEKRGRKKVIRHGSFKYGYAIPKLEDR
jgi:hypothetical protein